MRSAAAAQNAAPLEADDYLHRPYDFGAPAAPARNAARRREAGIERAPKRLTSQDLGLVINTADPYSIEVGEFYAKARRLAPQQVLRLELPTHGVLDPKAFDALAHRIDAFFGKRVQALALAWTVPYAVSCNSITGALAFGFDPALCAKTCAPSRPSPYFDSATARPYEQFRIRPSMLLAAHDAADARRLIERGIASDGSLGLRGATPVHAWFLTTDDAARSVRAPLFPPSGFFRDANLEVHSENRQSVDNVERVLLYETGLPTVPKLDTVRWVPGALADHLTSFGGVLDGGTGQMSSLDWITAGATASYGTVSEPCAHPQKFPHPGVLLANYLLGATAIEAYWKSVAWPQQGVFVGEPLAAPFARR